MITNQISPDSIVKSHGHTSIQNFAAAAVALDFNGNAYHAGIVIKCFDVYKLLHYTGSKVLFDDVPEYGFPNWYYHKELALVDNFLVEGFYAHCLRAANGANPKYGFAFPGSFYEEGKFFSKDGFPEYMTCVGFCLNVIQGFSPKKQFIDVENWGNYSDIPDQEKWVQKFIEHFEIDYPNFNSEDILKYLKRIAPDEYLSCAYYNHAPIKRSDINSILPQVKNELKIKMGLNTY